MLAASESEAERSGDRGANEPAHQLIGECVFQYESRQLRYIEPGKRHSKEVEISSGRANKKLKLDNNTFSVKETRTIPDESIHHGSLSIEPVF